MTTTKKVIGRVPTYRGPYKDDVLYHIQNIVSYLGSAFISKKDNNRNKPCIIENNTFVLLDGWDFFADSSFSYLQELSEIYVTKSVFDEIEKQGLLDVTKKYYIYEDAA